MWLPAKIGRGYTLATICRAVLGRISATDVSRYIGPIVAAGQVHVLSASGRLYSLNAYWRAGRQHLCQRGRECASSYCSEYIYSIEPRWPAPGISLTRSQSLLRSLAARMWANPTLFNRFDGTRHAIVDDQPGVTRDRREGDGRLAEMRFQLIDTAGLEKAKSGNLEDRMRQQTELAVPAGRYHPAGD